MSREEYREALKALDRPTRLALLYLEETRMQPIIQQGQPLHIDLTPIQVKLDSLQKQMDSVKSNLRVVIQFKDEHDKQEDFVKKTVVQLETLINDAKKYQKELYETKMSIGMRRSFRDIGYNPKDT